MNKTIIKPTAFGPVVVLWSRCRGGPRVARVLLSDRAVSAERKAARLFPGSTVSDCAEIAVVCADIAAFLEGEQVRFSLGTVQLESCPPFQRTVLRAEHGVPWGCVTTYRRLAACTGRPGAARAVGNALAANPFPIIVPCHRAIRSDRSLGGYQGGLAMERALLEREGLGFDSSGRVLALALTLPRAGREERWNRETG